MKRSQKIIRNILLIIIILAIIGYTKQYRLTPVNVAKEFGELIFLENPNIELLNTNDKYSTYILEEDNVLACTVVQKELGFVYHPADFGSSFITTSNTENEVVDFKSRCSLTVDRYFNNNYKDKYTLFNILELKNYSFNYYKPIQIYQVKDIFSYQFHSGLETFSKYLDMNYQEYVDNPELHKVEYYYDDSNLSLSSKSSEISNQSAYTIYRTDEKGNTNRFDFYYLYIINNPTQLTVKEVIEIGYRLNELSIFDDSFLQFETIESLMALSEDRIIEILNKKIRSINIDITVNKVGIYGVSKTEDQNLEEKSSLELFVEYNKVNSIIERNDTSLDDFKELRIDQVLSSFEGDKALFKTNDENYIYLDRNSYLEFGPTVITSDDTKIQVFFRVNNIEEYNTLVSTKPNLDDLIEQIIKESYTEINKTDQIKSVAQNIHQSLVDNLLVKYSTISVSIIGKALKD